MAKFQKKGVLFGVGKFSSRYNLIRFGEKKKYGIGHKFNAPKTSYFTDIFKRILSELNKVWNKEPLRQLAFRIQYDSNDCIIEIKNKKLILFRNGGYGNNWVFDLDDYDTVESLKDAINSKPGYTVVPVNDSYDSLSPLALVEGSANIKDSNGDHVYVHTNYNWSIFKTIAYLLDIAFMDMKEMLKEMYINTSTGIWLDYWSKFFLRNRRKPGETDKKLRVRIINALKCRKVTIPSIYQSVNEVFPPGRNDGGFELIEITEPWKKVFRFSMSTGRFSGAAKIQDYQWYRMKAFIVRYKYWDDEAAELLEELRAAGIKVLYECLVISPGFNTWMMGNWAMRQDAIEDIDQKRFIFSINSERNCFSGAKYFSGKAIED